MPDKSTDNVNVVPRRTRQTTSHMLTRPQVRANRLNHEFLINNGHMVSVCMCRIACQAQLMILAIVMQFFNSPLSH
jgi:hypothetical protein